MDPLRHARHNLRGRINALKLCVTAIAVLDSRQELLEFLDMIEEAADKTVESLDEFEALLDKTDTPAGDHFGTTNS